MHKEEEKIGKNNTTYTKATVKGPISKNVGKAILQSFTSSA